MFWFIFILLPVVRGDFSLNLLPEQLLVEVGTNATFQVELRNEPAADISVSVAFSSEYDDLAKVEPENVTVKFNATTAEFDVQLIALRVGRSSLTATASWEQPSSKREAFLHVKVHKSKAVEWVSVVIGWMYFVSWSLSFYPQIYTNYRKKSVVGYNFDYLFLMTYGFVTYNTFNCGLYLIPSIKFSKLPISDNKIPVPSKQDINLEYNGLVALLMPTKEEQFAERYPKSINPVRLNDLFFSMHCLWGAAILILQCIIYERGSQAVSKVAKIIIVVYTFIIGTYCTLAGIGTVLWLDVFYLCSYVKLLLGMKKYIPQVYMNYRRKSTHGFSIGNVSLDLAGGVMTILQMVLDGHNYGDWGVFSENPTKFGLGLLSISFCSMFYIQHFVLYTHKNCNKK